MSTTKQTPAAGGKTFLGHPRMLANLFSVELWERFSFYGMQGILLIYLYYSAAHIPLTFVVSLALANVAHATIRNRGTAPSSSRV